MLRITALTQAPLFPPATPKKRRLLVGVALALAGWLSLASATEAAVIAWDAGGDGASLYAEANWEITSGSIGGAGVGDNPPNGTINAGSPVNHDLVATFGGLGGGAGAGSPLRLGAQGSLSMSGGSLLIRGGIENSNGGNDPGQPSLTLTGGTITLNYFSDIGITLGGDGSLTLAGGGNPLNHSTNVNFTSNYAVLLMENESPSQFVNEHLHKISVRGQPAVLGENLRITSFNGTSGARITAAIVPEPSSVLLLGLGLLGLLAATLKRWPASLQTRSVSRIE